MRMWMVDPRGMCRKHLLGEHVELHMLQGSIRKGIDLDGFVVNNLLEAGAMQVRHAALVEEMRARGYNHASPLPDHPMDDYPLYVVQSRVNRGSALAELHRRCPECRDRYQSCVQSASNTV